MQACHELLVWLIPLLDHFPRSRRFTLGERLESGALGLLLASLSLAGWTAPAGAPEQPAPQVTVAAEGAGNTVTVSAAGDTLRLDVYSPRGLGKAIVEPVSGACPKAIVLRLHTQGLEAFHLTCEGRVVTAAVVSREPRHIIQTVRSTGADERPLTPDSPYWLPIQVVAALVLAPLPSEPGYFEITLPTTCLCAGRRTFSIQWLDFYR